MLSSLHWSVLKHIIWETWEFLLLRMNNLPVPLQLKQQIYVLTWNYQFLTTSNWLVLFKALRALSGHSAQIKYERKSPKQPQNKWRNTSWWWCIESNIYINSHHVILYYSERHDILLLRHTLFMLIKFIEPVSSAWAPAHHSQVR